MANEPLASDPLVCKNCGGPKHRAEDICDECRDAPREPGIREPTDNEGADSGDEHYGAD